jgi:peroxiredoxin
MTTRHLLSFLFLFLFIFFSNTTIFLFAQSRLSGKRVDNFILKDYTGKNHSLNDFKNNKAVVLIFLSTECPVSNGYNKRIKNLYDTFHSKNISFIGINSNKQESVDDIKRFADDNKLDFIILKDNNNIIANKLGAIVTPEVFVLDNNSRIIYHGMIDDSRREDEVKNEYLKNVLTAVLKGEKIKTPETKAFGCTIKKVD